MTAVEAPETSFSWQVLAPLTRAVTFARPPVGGSEAGAIWTGPIEGWLAPLADAFTAGTRPMALSAVAATRKDKGRLMHALMYTS